MWHIGGMFKHYEANAIDATTIWSYYLQMLFICGSSHTDYRIRR
jgi:hypothetical protein